ncbi:MAG: hypothetical protein A3D44_04030 [Candidatus Staskawiczbacteria bacterium RIFCSPHIGHO2_02_FULL_42_22]|uniref:Endolytic murein transglycosylase n=1 Tax=Candidatus Staskawiczbacteria bacterium RIFCSPHIGHO2_02_FULL_42_22 TaxID=1802207 RepID=A0A1G2I1F5_9BACT|nr:MAG: hypothetical protein A3D44_04030 [Candidatus Staskawiczbacteria bacterium RIFCSPHIGHO2_02_FULL_42_22]
MTIGQGFKKKLFNGICVFLALIFFVALFEIYAPKSFSQKPSALYVVQKGSGGSAIASDLKAAGMIKSTLFFRAYAIVSGSYTRLQAGTYEISPYMSIAAIIKKLATGDVAKNTITIIEGWDKRDIIQYAESKNLFLGEEFLAVFSRDFSSGFSFLSDKPRGSDLEGYIFPDTYQLKLEAAPEEFIKIALANFDKKLTQGLRQEIAGQGKTIFGVITMASMIEKEVQSMSDKKMVSGILWKRLEAGMPLQVDATVNYVTGKNTRSTTIVDTGIDSPYNTYKYSGLPKGPIGNPGIDSIIAAVYPAENPYWYYLSTKEGKTIFSKTLEEHNAAVAKYLK